MILVYAFSNQWGTNISRRTLLEIEKILPKNNLINYQIVYFHPKSFFNKYIKSFCTSSPLSRGDRGGLIIGLGDFFGDISKIRLETITHNQYAQNSIYPFSPINLDISLPPLEDIDEKLFTISEKMGKYNCNWIVYSTELYIRQHSPSTKQLFFHLPRSQNATILARQIVTIFEKNNILSYS